MKLFRVFLGIFLLVVLFLGIAFLLPHTYRIERSIVVNRPVNQTFQYLNTIKNWKDWSPWNTELDSSLVFFYSRNIQGTGARQYFRGGLYGCGRLNISNSEINERIDYDLWMNEGTITTKATFLFEPIGGKTKLTWLDSGDVGNNPIFRYMLSSKISSTEQAFEQGLITIKRAAEEHTFNQLPALPY